MNQAQGRGQAGGKDSGEPGRGTLAELGPLLNAREETLATAESLTGGLLGAAITSVPGASTIYLGGVISYATALKVALLGVDKETVALHGVVSAECAAEMAAGARASTGATWGISTTGVAGPDEQEGKPVGTVFIGVSGPVDDVLELALEGDRNAIRAATVEAAVCFLDEVVRRSQ